MRIGIVGGGQLARMMLEEASALGIEATVLAESPDDGAAKVCSDVIIGAPTDESALAALAERCDVITLDHELVDLDLLGSIAASGTPVRPSPASLGCAVDKSIMRRRLGAAGFPMPAHRIVEAGGEPAGAEELGRDLGWPLVVKAARGGYDGRGVFVCADPDEASRALEDLRASGIDAVVEEAVAIESELAALVVRRPGGELAGWRAVETAQVGGVCREVLVPGGLDADLAAEAEAMAERIAEQLDLVGTMAVELFATKDGLVVNELAMRPHNSGHWTQDGAVTSQFANHLRAVLDLPLGSTQTSATAVASVNVFGGEHTVDLDEALLVALSEPDVQVHLYGKAPRPGRKLGHVTVVGENGDEVRTKAWRAAVALGTPVPAEMEGVIG